MILITTLNASLTKLICLLFNSIFTQCVFFIRLSPFLFDDDFPNWSLFWVSEEAISIHKTNCHKYLFYPTGLVVWFYMLVHYFILSTSFSLLTLTFIIYDQDLQIKSKCSKLGCKFVYFVMSLPAANSFKVLFFIYLSHSLSLWSSTSMPVSFSLPVTLSIYVYAYLSVLFFYPTLSFSFWNGIHAISL